MQVFFSRDGRVLASAGRDDQMKIWNTTSVAETAVIRDSIQDYDRPCSLSPDGSRIAVINRNNKMNIFDTAPPRLIASLPANVPDWDNARQPPLRGGNQRRLGPSLGS